MGINAIYDDLPNDMYEHFQNDRNPDYHAVYSIQLCELINGGMIDFSSEEWDFDSYNKEQRDRFWKKFEARFYWREIGIFPPGKWKWELLRKLNEIMPKYKPVYEMLENGQNILQKYGSYGKSRNIFSEFPQTQLSGTNQDYASNATDREHEEIYLGDWLEQIEKLKNYNDVDVMILNELETMFSVMFTVNINGY